MTVMLASVRTLAEARLACRAGADILDLKEPNRGALGALPLETVRVIADTCKRQAVLSATLGDPPLDCAQAQRAVAQLQAAGVDIVKLGLYAGQALPEPMRALLEHWEWRTPRLVVVWLLGRRLPWAPVPGALCSGKVYGIMLDTWDKEAGSLRQRLPAETLRSFLLSARKAGLRAGLAGSLAEQDVAPLLALGPDYLGFRSALCRHGRGGVLDFDRTRRIRASIPRQNVALPEFADRLNQRGNRDEPVAQEN